MKKRASGLVLVAAGVLACSSGGAAGDGGARDAGSRDATRDVATSADVPLVCVDAATPDAVDAMTPLGPATCGGSVAVAGPTPYGAFVATDVSAELNSGDCAGLTIVFDDRSADAGQREPIILAAFIAPEDYLSGGLEQPLLGTFDVHGSVARGSDGRALDHVRIRLTSGEAVFPTDGGPFLTVGVGRGEGLLVGHVDADTGCGHVTGTFSVPICGFGVCQI